MTVRTIPPARVRGSLDGMAVIEVHELGAALESVRDTWQGAWPHPVHLVTMVAWSLAVGAVAARTFRWE